MRIQRFLRAVTSVDIAAVRRPTARFGESSARRPWAAAAASAGWTWRPGSPGGSCTGPSAAWSPRSSPRPAGIWSRSLGPRTSPPWSTRTCPCAPRSPPSSCWRSAAPSPCSRCRGGAGVWVGEAPVLPRSARSASSSTAAADRRCASPARPPSAPRRRRTPASPPIAHQTLRVLDWGWVGLSRWMDGLTEVCEECDDRDGARTGVFSHARTAHCTPSTQQHQRAHAHTHTHTRLLLWIVGTFYILLYWPNDFFYPLNLQKTCLHCYTFRQRRTGHLEHREFSRWAAVQFILRKYI